jgi:hypothetical protein
MIVFLRRLGLVLVFIFLVFAGTAQVFNRPIQKTFKIITDTLVLDSLSLVPGSIAVKLFPQTDTTLEPRIDYKYHALIFERQRPDSVVVLYRRFPFNFEKKFYHRDQRSLFADLSKPNNPFIITYGGGGKQEALFQNDGLTKNGNISRGISFGNTQDVVVNSNLNLQVSGKLTPEIDLVMAATDNNIPFQADGTTAQLQEFDKVFIQLSTASTKMVVGDYQLSRPLNSYFMNYYKRAQGAHLENFYVDSASKNPLKFRTQVSGAVSRGKFSRQVFFGTENNQGPYRLRGAANEPFIIVLSGTEKIYIDGRLMMRGQENDYIIDYNSGEVTFTARQIITKDKRIVAEFQYAERNYARSLFFFGEEVSAKKTTLFLNVFSEQDNKNRPLQQTLSQAQKDIMIALGDTISKAFYSGVDSTALFDNSNVFYLRKDSLVAGNLYKNVYVYSTDPSVAKYLLKWSNVGSGRGNYNQVFSAANGRVYKWVAPVNGEPQGSFEPLIPLVTPKQNQMVTAGFSYSITGSNVLGLEGAFTKNDINRFSSVDKGNDEGAGIKFSSRNTELLRKDSSNRETKLFYNGSYEYVQKQFTQVERFRSIEFERDWNRPLGILLLNDQHLGAAEIGLSKTNRAALSYAAQFFNEGENYEGLKQGLSAAYANKGFKSDYKGSYLSSKDFLNGQNAGFYRHKSLVSQNIGKIKLGYFDDFENNIFRNAADATLLPRAYQFWEWEGSISNSDSSVNRIKVFYRERRDQLAYGNELKDSTLARNVGIQSAIYSIKNNPISVIMTYRKLELKNVVGTFLKPDNTLLSRLEYNPRYFKGFISAGLFYETGYGLENKREYYYLEVAPGQGQYAWVDYNGNSIKELNEFEVAQFSDQARFIRIYTPTNAYVKVLQNLLSLSLNIRPSAIIKNPQNMATRFLKLWSLQTAFRMDNKTSDNKSLSNFNPLIKVSDTLLFASNRSLRQSVFFDQGSPVFSADYTYTDNQSKQLLVNGIEDRVLLQHEVKWRLNFFQAWALNNSHSWSQKGNSSQFFASRNYLITSLESEQRLIYQPNTIFRLSAIYKYTEKQNQIDASKQAALINTYAIELKYNQTEKGSLTGRMDLIKINYSGDVNSPVAYEMLNALNKGENYTWEISYQRNLSNNIQMSINYNGRKTPGTAMVHLGGAQIRAFF